MANLINIKFNSMTEWNKINAKHVKCFVWQRRCKCLSLSLHAIGNILVQHSLHIRTMTIHYNWQKANFLPSFDGPSERDAMLINSKDNAEWLRSNKMDVVKLCFIAYQMESIQNRHFAIRWYGICRYHTSLSSKCARVCVWTIRYSHTRNGTSQWIPKMVKRKMIIFASSLCVCVCVWTCDRFMQSPCAFRSFAKASQVMGNGEEVCILLVFTIHHWCDRFESLPLSLSLSFSRSLCDVHIKC